MSRDGVFRPMLPARRLLSSGLAKGFGLLELLTALAFLVIVVGLMVSLARYVRTNSAEQITRQLLRDIEQRLSVRAATSSPAGPGPIELIPPPSDANEAAWAAYAVASNAQIRRLLGTPEVACDAWGNPLAYFPVGRRPIGTAPRDRPFCVSPGPDGLFLTRSDNLYSYEQLLPTPDGPSGGGHDE